MIQGRKGTAGVLRGRREGHRGYFNGRAADWDTAADPGAVEILSKAIAGLSIAKGGIALDVGTGTGASVPILSESVGPDGLVVAADSAEEMLRIARMKSTPANVSFTHADIHDTPFGDGFFDEVICGNCFSHFRDKHRAVREMGRLLRHGGRLAVVYSTGRDDVNETHRRIGGVFEGDFLPGDAEMASLLRRAGFGSIVFDHARNHYLVTAIKAQADGG